jgi:hypothetical protein
MLSVSGMAKLQPFGPDGKIARQNRPQRSTARNISAPQLRKAKALRTKNFIFCKGSAKPAERGIRQVECYAPQVHLLALQVIRGAG